jgi:hypothetical protein
MEQDGCLMTYFMFQEQYGIERFVEKKEKNYRGANKGTKNVDFYRY